MKVAFSNKSGISMALVTRSDNYWDLFWSTLVSATVENEAPDEVVLTFGLANTSLTKDDFSIEGFTIDSLSRDATNKILTLILTEDFESDTEAEITFGKTGESYSITNNVTAFDWDAYWEDAYFQDGEIFDNGKVVLQFDDGYADSYTN